MSSLAKTLLLLKNLLIIICTPLLFCWIPILFPTREGKCGYGVIIIAVYWMTEVMPLSVTALLPVVVFPLLGVQDSDSLCRNYMKDAIILLTGGLIIAVAVEKWNLHKRIALGVLLLVGSKPKWLMFGFMITTALLSMCISNTATTAMMVPISQAVLDELKKSRSDHVDDSNVSMAVLESGDADGDKDDCIDQSDKKTDSNDQPYHAMCVGLTLCICYSASIGGTATLTGTGTNIAAKGILDTLYNNKSGLTYSSWFIFAFPCMLINLLLCWCWLQLLFLGWRTLFGCCGDKSLDKETEKAAKRIIRREYDLLGPICFAEIAVLVHFIAMVLLWLSREIRFSDESYGWALLFKKSAEGNEYVTDATSAIVVAVLLFVFPASPIWKKGLRTGGPYKTLLDWTSVHNKLPWNVILLLGGGFALADACKQSGLSRWLGNQMQIFDTIPPWAMVFIICIFVSLCTEVTSNTATSTIFTPILAELGESLGVNPLYIVLPVTLVASFAFMLPVATPPNAIVFSYGHLRVIDMVKTGAFLNFACVMVVTLAINTWGDAIFDLQTFPDWVSENTEKTTPHSIMCAANMSMSTVMSGTHTSL